MSGVKKHLRVDWELASRVITAYEEIDSFGRRKWSQQEIADAYGLGASTVNRIINRSGPYRAMPEVRTKQELEFDISKIEEFGRELALRPVVSEGPREIDKVFVEGRLKAPNLEKLNDPEIKAQLQAEVPRRTQEQAEKEAAFLQAVNDRLLGKKKPVGAVEPEELMKELTGSKDSGYA